VLELPYAEWYKSMTCKRHIISFPRKTKIVINQFSLDLRKEFAQYTGKKLSQDLMAGLTVAAVALPLALAFE